LHVKRQGAEKNNTKKVGFGKGFNSSRSEYFLKIKRKFQAKP